MRWFASPGQAGRFCHAHDSIYEPFRPPQQQLTAAIHRAPSLTATCTWNPIIAELPAKPATPAA